MKSVTQPHTGTNDRMHRHERYGCLRVWRNGSGTDASLLALLLPDPDRVFGQGDKLASPWHGPSTDKVRITLNGEAYFFKRYNDLGLRYGIRHLFRYSRAVKSWLAAWRFARCGVPTPEPVLCLEERRFGLLGRSYLVFPFLADDASFLDLWPRLDRTARRSCLVSLGELLGRMHRQGLLHGDLNWRNLVAVRHDDGYRFWLVDLDGSRKVRKVTPALAHKDLAHFLRDMERAGADAELRGLFRESWQRAAGLQLPAATK